MRVTSDHFNHLHLLSQFAEVFGDVLIELWLTVLSYLASLSVGFSTVEPYTTLALILPGLVLGRFSDELLRGHYPCHVHPLRVENEPVVVSQLVRDGGE